MATIDITDFDNEISILHKWAQHYNIPVKYIITSKENESLSYHNGIQLFINALQTGSTLTDLADNPLFSDFGLKDIVILYAANKLDQIRRLTNVKTQIDQTSRLVEEINEFYKSKEFPESYKSPTDLRDVVADWRKDYNQQIQSDKVILDQLVANQKILSKFVPAQVSPIDVHSAEFVFTPTTDKIQPTAEDALQIFDDAEISENVPYIHLNIKNPFAQTFTEHNLSKLYKGTSADTDINYTAIIPNPELTNRENVIYTTIWIGTGSFTKTPQNTFQHGFYDLETNKFRVKTILSSNITTESLISHLTDAFKLDFSDYVENHLSGAFRIYGIEIDGNLFVDMVLNDPVFKTYFFVDETVKSFALKKRLTLRYKSIFDEDEAPVSASPTYILNPSALHLTINQLYATGGEKAIQVEEGQEYELNLEKDFPYLEIKFSKAQSREVLEHFLKIFARVLVYYNSTQEKLRKEYKRFIPELFDKPAPIKTKAVSKTKRTGEKLQELSKLAPDLFVKGYGRYGCQKKNQPKWVEPEEISGIEKETFKFQNKTYHRQVLAFPPDRPKYFFACDVPTGRGEGFPFPFVKKNNLPNKDIYPCIPCCGKREKLSKKEKAFEKCKTEPVGAQLETKATGHEMKGNKTVKPGHTGLLRSDLAELLALISKKESDKINRFGIQISPNSLIHSVLQAIGDKKYPKSLSAAEEYVKKVRRGFSSKIETTLLAQELYDYNREEIKQLLNDVESFFDPRLYYRVLEEIYNVNIFVFQPFQAETTQFEIPRFKIFPARTPRPDLPSILIYKSEGTIAQALAQPQCELIVFNKGKTFEMLWSKKVSQGLFDAQTSTLRTLSWFAQPEENKVSDEKVVYTANIYSKYDFLDYTRNSKDQVTATHQVLDNYGKMRGLIYPLNKGNLATILFPPSQPVNLPRAESFPEIEGRLVIEKFGDPAFIAQNNEGKTIGFWYAYDEIKYGLFFPIKPTTRYSDFQVGPGNPMVAYGTDIVQKYRKIRRDFEIILQIVKYLYILAGRPPLEEFIENYVKKGPGAQNSENIYALQALSLQRVLPKTKDIKVALHELTEIAPTLIRNNKIYLYSKKFAEGIAYLLRVYIKETDGLNLNIPSVLTFETLMITDFQQQPNVAIFLNNLELESWLASRLRLTFENLQVVDRILNEPQTDPYIYAGTEFYLVQNVKDADFDRALEVAKSWYEQHINPGYEARPFTDEVPHRVLTPTTDGKTLVLSRDNTEDYDEFVEILDYGDEKYAALLPL